MIPELTLTGPPRERGRHHGEELRSLIASAVDAWFEHLAERTDPRAFVAEITRRSGLREAAEKRAGDLLTEVAGIAEGAAQDFDTMFAWQLIDECWWFLDETTGATAPDETPRAAARSTATQVPAGVATPPTAGQGPLQRCSALALNDGSRGMVAQTQDLYRHCDGAQVMLRCVDQSGLEILAPSLAGMLALNGVNRAGLAVGITTLSQLPHSCDGVGSGLLVSMLLRCTTVAEALALLERVPIASGNSFVIGTRDRSLVVEVSSEMVAVSADGRRGLHTNHVLVQQPHHHYPHLEHSQARLRQLEEAVRPDSTVTDLAAMYSSGAVCESRAADTALMSVGTMIFELDDEPLCHYAAGPLDTDELVTYRMRSRPGAGA